MVAARSQRSPAVVSFHKINTGPCDSVTRPFYPEGFQQTHEKRLAPTICFTYQMHSNDCAVSCSFDNLGHRCSSSILRCAGLPRQTRPDARALSKRHTTGFASALRRFFQRYPGQFESQIDLDAYGDGAALICQRSIRGSSSSIRNART